MLASPVPAILLFAGFVVFILQQLIDPMQNQRTTQCTIAPIPICARAPVTTSPEHVTVQQCSFQFQLH